MEYLMMLGIVYILGLFTPEIKKGVGRIQKWRRDRIYQDSFEIKA